MIIGIIEQIIDVAEASNRISSFVLPIQDGTPFLTERKKDPYKGWYCLIGGKREGRERPEETASREFCEEMYGGGERVPYYKLLLLPLGFIFDEEFNYLNHLFLGIADALPPFVLNDAEVRRKRNVDEINPAQFNPITRITLDYVVRTSIANGFPEMWQGYGLHTQIPPLGKIPEKYLRWY